MENKDLKRVQHGTPKIDFCGRDPLPFLWYTHISFIHLLTHDFDSWLRVVCVGGDGMFSEIIHGLVWRTQIDGGVDPNCPEETLFPCSLRIGIIPAGQKHKHGSWNLKKNRGKNMSPVIRW